MARLIRLIDLVFQTVLSVLCVGLLVVMLTAILGQVVSRYGFNAPVSWSEELARYVMIWLAMLGAALAMRRGQHILLGDLIPFSPRVRAILRVVCAVVVIAMLALLAWQAWTLVGRTSRQMTAALMLPMSWMYAAIPTGAVLMIVGLLLGWANTPQEPSSTLESSAEK